MPDLLVLAALLALILGALGWNLYWLYCCLDLLADLRSHQGDLRAILLGQHQSTTGSLNALHEEVRRGPQLPGRLRTEEPPPGKEGCCGQPDR